MARCRQCNAMIVLGGARKDGARYCNAACMKKAQQSRQVHVPDHLLEATTGDVHAGPCSICQGDGPVDVHNVHSIWSALWFTQWKTVPTIGCRSCGSKAQLRGVLFSSLLGWWGFPWGVIVTPIQILRNFIGMARPPHPDHPSDQLRDLLREELSERWVGGDELVADGAGDDDFDDEGSDAIATVCPGCDHGFDVATQMAGRTDYCPECGIAFTVPDVVNMQQEMDADFPTDDVLGRWSSTTRQGSPSDTDSAVWSDTWDEQWSDVDVRYGGTRGKRSRGSSVANRSGRRKHPILSLLLWVVVAVVSVAILVGVIGFVLMDEDERPGGAGQPEFGAQPFRQFVPVQRPIANREQRFRDVRRQMAPPRGLGVPPALPTEGDRGGVQPFDPRDGQPRPISQPRDMKTVRRMSAVIFEKMAVRNSELSAWYWKEAATKWLQLKQTDKALAAARNADKAPLETRSPRMTHIWHRQLGDIYLKLGEPLLAIPHFEAALKSTEIPGDIAGIQKSLHEAVQQSQP